MTLFYSSIKYHQPPITEFSMVSDRQSTNSVCPQTLTQLFSSRCCMNVFCNLILQHNKLLETLVLLSKKMNKDSTYLIITTLPISSIISSRKLHSRYSNSTEHKQVFISVAGDIIQQTYSLFILPTVKEFEYLHHINQKQKSHTKLCQKFDFCTIIYRSSAPALDPLLPFFMLLQLSTYQQVVYPNTDLLCSC